MFYHEDLKTAFVVLHLTTMRLLVGFNTSYVSGYIYTHDVLNPINNLYVVKCNYVLKLFHIFLIEKISRKK